MNPRLNPRDHEALSTFVDGALDARQRATLQARLKAEPELAQTLRELQATRALLQRAPQRKTPRNFTLTREMAGERQRGFSYSFASAAAAVLLVFVTAGDLLAGGQLFLPTAAPEPSMLLMSESAPANEAPFDMLATPEEAAEQDAVEEDAYGGMYADDAEGERMMKDTDAPSDLQGYFLAYARTIEVALLVIAIIAGLLAWQRRKQFG